MESDELEEIDRAAQWIAGMYGPWGKPDQASKWRQRHSTRTNLNSPAGPRNVSAWAGPLEGSK